MSKSSTVDAILARLAGPEFDPARDAIRSSFAGMAARMVERWVARLIAEGDAVLRPGYGFYVRGLEVPPGWMSTPVPQRGGDRRDYWPRCQQAARDGLYTVRSEAVQADADREWETTKAFYAWRVADRIDSLLGETADLAFNLQLISQLVGSVTASLGNRTLTLKTSLKTNYRYGEHSANGHLTVYRQVPTTIEACSGFDALARQAELERERAAALVDRKAAIAALSAALEQADRRKEHVREIYDTLSFCARYSAGVLAPAHRDTCLKHSTALGLADVPSFAEAKLMLREARASAKAAKQALADARQLARTADPTPT